MDAASYRCRTNSTNQDEEEEEESSKTASCTSQQERQQQKRQQGEFVRLSRTTRLSVMRENRESTIGATNNNSKSRMKMRSNCTTSSSPMIPTTIRRTRQGGGGYYVQQFMYFCYYKGITMNKNDDDPADDADDDEDNDDEDQWIKGTIRDIIAEQASSRHYDDERPRRNIGKQHRRHHHHHHNTSNPPAVLWVFILFLSYFHWWTRTTVVFMVVSSLRIPPSLEGINNNNSSSNNNKQKYTRTISRRRLLQQKHHHHSTPIVVHKNNTNNNSNSKNKSSNNTMIVFPSREDTLEMAALSLLVYYFKDETNDENVCDFINNWNTLNTTDPFLQLGDIKCHWYHHSRTDEGTQVMIVSSKMKNYLAIVFAGTDDVRTSLTDANILSKPYGDGLNITLMDPRIRIHAGFNNAIFHNNLYYDIEKRFHQLRILYPNRQLFTTGHSLGAAGSVITATALALRLQQSPTNSTSLLRRRPHQKRKNSSQKQSPVIVSLNFGCPQIGNSYWRDYINTNLTLQTNTIKIWRIVLGWDLVPRLPEFFYHEGHTIQLYRNGSFSYGGGGGTKVINITTADAYYQHYGSIDQGLAGVPFGWGSKPFIWMPGALESHHIYKYWLALRDWPSADWVHDFVHIDYNHSTNNNDDDDHRPPHVNDDHYVDPPDDDIRADMWNVMQEQQESVQ